MSYRRRRRARPRRLRRYRRMAYPVYVPYPVQAPQRAALGGTELLVLGVILVGFLMAMKK